MRCCAGIILGIILLELCLVPHGSAIVGWTSVGANVGNTRHIALSPADPHILYAGSDNGFFRSEDEGFHWQTLSETNMFRTVICSSTTPDTLYAGANCYYIHVSEDGGETWIPFDVGVSVEALSHFDNGVVNPSNPKEAFMAGANGIYWIFKTGETWQQPQRILSHGWKSKLYSDLVMFPDDPDTLFVATYKDVTGPDGIFKMVRQNGSWVPAGEAVKPETESLVYALCRDPMEPNILYCGTTAGTVYKTDRMLAGWSKLPDLPVPDNCPIFVLTCASKEPRELLAGRQGYILSYKDDRWTDLQIPIHEATIVRSIESSPEGETVIAGTSLGCQVFMRSMNRWQARNRGLKNLNFSDVLFHPLNQREIVVSTFEQGIMKSIDSGTTWIQRNCGLPEIQIHCLTRDPGSENIVIAGLMAGMAVSDDGGDTWRECGSIGGEPLDFEVYCIDAAEVGGNTVWICGSFWPDDPAIENIYRSTDGGDTWTAAATPFKAGSIRDIIVDPTDTDIVYVCVEKTDYSGCFWKSEDSGQIFMEWTAPGLPSAGLPTRMVIDPNNSSRMWTAIQKQGIYWSIDGGATFTKGNGPDQFYWYRLEMDSADPDTLYAVPGQDQRPDHELLITHDAGVTWQWSGQFDVKMRLNCIASDPHRNRTWVLPSIGKIYETIDHGSTWTELSRYFIQLPFIVNDVVADPEHPDVLYVATEGNGVWKSIDAGWSWFSVNNGLPEEFHYIRCLDLDRRNTDRLFLGCADAGETDHKVFETTDGAAQWQERGTGTIFGAPVVDLEIIDLEPDDTGIWLVTYGNGPFLSVDGGDLWQSRPINPEPPGGLLTSVTQSDYAGENDEPWIFVSSHGGGGSFVYDYDTAVFMQRSNGLPQVPGTDDIYVDFVESDPETRGMFWAGTPYGLYVSSDYGITWVPSFGINGEPAEHIIPRMSGMAFLGHHRYFFDARSGIHHTVSGQLWNTLETGQTAPDLQRISCLAIPGTVSSQYILAGCGREGGAGAGRVHLSHPAPCHETGVDIWMPKHVFLPGDTCSVDAAICNAEGNTLQDHPLFVLLDVYGQYYFAPGFSGFDYYGGLDFPVGETVINILPEFIWPEGVGAAAGIYWYGGLTDPGFSKLVGYFGFFEFAWADI